MTDNEDPNPTDPEFPAWRWRVPPPQDDDSQWGPPPASPWWTGSTGPADEEAAGHPAYPTAEPFPAAPVAPPGAWPPPPVHPQTGPWSAPGWAGHDGERVGTWAAPGGAGAGWPPAGGPAPGWPPHGYGPAGSGYGEPPGPGRTRRGLVGVIAMALAAALLGFALSSVVADVRNAFNRTATGGVAPLAQATSPSPAASAVATKVDVGVVDINTRLGYQEAEAAGTGMVITANGEVLTNNHVVDGATSITATIVTTGRTYTAKVLGTDPSEDVALIQLEGASGLKTVPLGDSSKVKAGQSVVAIGNAGGVGGAPSVVTGSVLATGESITATDDNGGNPEQLSNLIRTNAPLQPGDSGGPLADPSAKVIGMDTAASSTGRFRFRQTGSNESFAIPINQALGIAKQIESGKSTSNVHIGLPGFLGIEVVDAGQGRSGGASIAAVVPGAPAERAGLAAGDVIQSVDGQAVTSAQQLTSTLQAHHAGDRVTIAWSDSQGRSHHATVTLTTGPAD